MKIAQVTPLYEAVPPKLYGGTERVVAHLTDALVDLGHDVTLFASAEAETKAQAGARARPGDPAGSRAAEVRPRRPHDACCREVLDRADEFDVIHFHTDMIQFPMSSSSCAGKTLTTLHGRLDLKDLPGVYERWQRVRRWSRSATTSAARCPSPTGRRPCITACPPNCTSSRRSREGYLAFLGRISPEKRPDRAIEIATEAGQAAEDGRQGRRRRQGLLRDKIEPLIDGNPLIEFIGEIGDHQKSAFLGGADALLFPIDWPEPFGLVMIEAMACGTPVVAFHCGSTPEVIEDGATGFLVDTMEQADRGRRSRRICWTARPSAPASSCGSRPRRWRGAISTSTATCWPSALSPRQPLNDVVTPLRRATAGASRLDGPDTIPMASAG